MRWLLALFGFRPWEMGTVTLSYGTRVARRHRVTGEVQFVLWNAGEQGHKEDYWHRFCCGQALNFRADTTHWRPLPPPPVRDGEKP